MIVTLPDLPMNEEGQVKRPLILLVGSTGDWQVGVARTLEAKSRGTIVCSDGLVRGVGGSLGYPPDVILDHFYSVIPIANLVLIWVNQNPVWWWLEMGAWISYSHPSDHKFLWGMESGESFHHAGHLRWILERGGWPVHSTLEDLVTAAGVGLQERRRG